MTHFTLYDLTNNLFDPSVEGVPGLGRSMNNLFIVASKLIVLSSRANPGNLDALIDTIVSMSSERQFLRALYMAMIRSDFDWSLDIVQVQDHTSVYFKLISSTLMQVRPESLQQQPAVVEEAYCDLLQHCEDDMHRSYEIIKSVVSSVLRGEDCVSDISDNSETSEYFSDPCR